MALHSRSKRQYFLAGDTIFRQGDPGDYAYLIEEGTAQIIRTHPDGREQVLAHRSAGGIVGEMALLSSQPRTAHVRAITPCTVISIPRDDFQTRLDRADPMIKMVMQVMLARYNILVSGESTDQNAPMPDYAEAALIHHKAFDTIRITHDLKEAILNQDLRLFYQPIISLTTGKPVGFEALMRWQHPTRGLLNPVSFIPIAEDSGLIVHASRWALTESAAMLARLSDHHGLTDPWFLSLNYTGLDLSNPSFSEDVKNTLSDAQIAPERIKLEITERMLIDDPEGAIQSLERCKQTGLTVALDDFGTGYSSLSYLHRFPIDTMKIDRSFVNGMMKQDASMTLIKAIIALARGLDMDIVAEGVESGDEAAALRALGCDMAQGYHYARPMSEDDLILWLKQL